MSVLETIIGKRRPQFDNYDEVLGLLQKFMIESKSKSPIRHYAPEHQVVITMYAFGAMVYFAESLNVPEEENISVLHQYFERQNLSKKEAKKNVKTVMQKAEEPSMQWHVEIGYNSARYWHKDNDLNAPKALARLLKTLR